MGLRCRRTRAALRFAAALCVAIISAPLAGNQPALAPAGDAAAATGVERRNASDAFADDVTPALASRRLIIPIALVSRASLRDTFNERRGTSTHEAIDIAAARGTPVIAVDDGSIAKLFLSVPGGNTIYQFDLEGKFAYYYAHLDAYAKGLREGMTVKRGDLLGYVGTTGNAPPNAPHLHFAIFRLGPEKHWWQGTAVNPYPFLNDAER